jgi:hypothetical protein
MLEALERMENHQLADFGYNHNLINAIGTVLHYYGED